MPVVAVLTVRATTLRRSLLSLAPAARMTLPCGAAQIVDDDDIAWLEDGGEELLDMGDERFAIERSV